MSAPLCMGPKNGEPFADRCRAPASYRTPSGDRCETCAEREKAAIRDGACILAILADKKGVSRETLLAKYVRIQ